MRSVLERLKAGYDLLVIDSPPLQAVADASILSSFVDGTLLVIDASRSRRRSVRHARETMARAGAHVLGAVLNRIPNKAQAGYADYYGVPYGGEAASDGRAGADGLAGRSAP
jgi:Mrp family chromosome partitioning ATPase